MQNALALIVCLVLLAFAGLTRASFDSAGQPSLAKPEQAQANGPIAKLTEVQLDQFLVLRLNFVAVKPLKFVIVANPPPAKKAIRQRPFRK